MMMAKIMAEQDTRNETRTMLKTSLSAVKINKIAFLMPSMIIEVSPPQPIYLFTLMDVGWNNASPNFL